MIDFLKNSQNTGGLSNIMIRGVFRGGIGPWLPPLARQDSMFSEELHAKLRHAPPSLQVGRKL